MPSSMIRRIAIGAALCATVPALWALPTQYHLQDLGAGSQAVHINANGAAAGTDTSGGRHAPAVWADGRGQQRAYLYADGTYTDVGILAGYTQSVAADLNREAHVVGTSADAAYDLRQAFFWNGRKLHEVGTLGGQRSEAKALDNRDVVVGTAQTPDGAWHAFVRDMHAAGSHPQDLATLLDASGAGWSLDTAVSINKSG